MQYLLQRAPCSVSAHQQGFEPWLVGLQDIRRYTLLRGPCQCARLSHVKSRNRLLGKARPVSDVNASVAACVYRQVYI
jgi:hypothetical protein